MNTDERWADCPGYEGLYEISTHGRVYNPRRKRFIKGTVSQNGYRQVHLSIRGNRPRYHLVHALVLTAFVGPRPPGFVCDHISGDRLDNTLGNLEWVTPLENVLRAVRAGRIRPVPVCGSNHYRAKLTEEKVRAIRERHQAGERIVDLALEYEITPSSINKVVKRMTWKHIA